MITKPHLAATRRFIVRRVCYVLVAALLGAGLVSGCGDEQPKSGDLKKPTDTSQFKGMLGDQMKNANIKEKTPDK